MDTCVQRLLLPCSPVGRKDIQDKFKKNKEKKKTVPGVKHHFFAV